MRYHRSFTILSDNRGGRRELFLTRSRNIPTVSQLLKIWFSDQGRLLTRRRTEREQFCPGPGLEPGPLGFRANTLPLSYPGKVRIHDKIYLLELSFLGPWPNNGDYTKNHTRKTLLALWSMSSSSSECSAQRQILHCKRRNIGCSYAEGRSSTANSGTKAVALLGFNRCGSFPLLFAPHSLFSI